MVRSNNRPSAPMISGKLPLQMWITVPIFDLCFEEFSEGSSCGPVATSVVMAFIRQLAYQCACLRNWRNGTGQFRR